MPVAWKKLYGNGKVFFISIGHDPGEFKRYKNGWELLKRGLIWAGS
jgi:type 1 glutamine amidotransferase